jgi:hypothetical protein
MISVSSMYRNSTVVVPVIGLWIVVVLCIVVVVVSLSVVFVVVYFLLSV